MEQRLRQPSFLQTARTLFIVCAWLFVTGVVAQVFFAGLGVLVDPGYFAWHTTFAHVLEPLLLALLVTGVIGRVGWRTFGLNAFLFVLFGLQYVFMYGFQGPPRALHVVNALALFWFAVQLVQRSRHLIRIGKPTPNSSGINPTAKKGGLFVGRQLLGILAIGVGAVMLFGIFFDNGSGFIGLGGPGEASQQSTLPEPSPRASTAAKDENIQDQGATLFAQNCSSCHGQNGQGGVGPPLAGNEDLADTRKVVRQVLNGGSGMPAFGEQLPNEEIAAVATFIRSSWDNDFGPVSIEEVEAQR